MFENKSLAEETLIVDKAEVVDTSILNIFLGSLKVLNV